MAQDVAAGSEADPTARIRKRVYSLKVSGAFKRTMALSNQLFTALGLPLRGRWSDRKPKLMKEQTRRLGREGYEALSAMLQECLTCGALKDQPSAFGIALLLAMMNMTIEFILQHPSEADRFCDAGFTAFWNAVTKT